MSNESNGASKLALLKQKKSLSPTSTDDIEKAIDGLAASYDTDRVFEQIKNNSAIVNCIIDASGSMYGTEDIIYKEFQIFAKRLSAKIYETFLYLSVFNDDWSPRLTNVNAKEINNYGSFDWICSGGTNIYDSLFHAMRPIKKNAAVHKLHLIITDGEQESYSDHSLADVQKLIAARKKGGDYIFLLFNNYDSFYKRATDYALKLGIDTQFAADFSRNGDGVKIIFKSIENVLDSLRSTGTVPTDWSKAIAAHNANPSLKANEIKFLT